MNNTAPSIFIVDDEPSNLFILSEYLEDDYRLSTAEDGKIALRMLESEPEHFDIILLDRMMPNMDGIEVLARLKEHAVLKQCPVILQTARTGKEDILEGVKAGAYYYLPKPFDEDMLFSVVKAALRERQNYKDLQHALQKTTPTSELMDIAKFRFKNREQVRGLASLLANTCPAPESVVLGLWELMVNAVEHGNLGITYQEKSLLIKQENWAGEVKKRLSLEENRDKCASIEFQRKSDCIEFTIRDQGKGFDWIPYIQMSWDRATACHGRGIAMAGRVSFSRIEYRGCGNEVFAVVDCLPSTDRERATDTASGHSLQRYEPSIDTAQLTMITNTAESE